jgi:hypothetical protein
MGGKSDPYFELWDVTRPEVFSFFPLFSFFPTSSFGVLFFPRFVPFFLVPLLRAFGHHEIRGVCECVCVCCVCVCVCVCVCACV